MKAFGIVEQRRLGCAILGIMPRDVKSQEVSSAKMNRVALWEISFLILAQLLLLLKQVIDAASWLDFPPQQ